MTTQTTPDLAAGTSAYMSPEQILGKTIDVRSDLFSFGAVLYEMSTGQPAFAGADRGAIFDAILNREPVSITRLNYAVPPDLERIVRKALAKRPDERYQNALDLLTDLRTLRRQTESGVEPAPVVRGGSPLGCGWPVWPRVSSSSAACGGRVRTRTRFCQPASPSR